MRNLLCWGALALAMPATGAVDEKIATGHFQTAAGRVEGVFQCGPVEARAGHEVSVADGRALHRVVVLAASRPATAAELEQVNAIIGDAAIIGIGGGCMGSSAQFRISIWSPGDTQSGAVLVTIGADGDFRLL